jgi:hypothetical protein
MRRVGNVERSPLIHPVWNADWDHGFRLRWQTVLKIITFYKSVECLGFEAF